MNGLIAEIDWAQFFGLFNYWIVIFLMMTGFYIVIARENLIKTIIGLNIFQTSVFLLYITMGKVRGGTTPIIPPDKVIEHGHGEHGHDEHHGAANMIADTIGQVGFDEHVTPGSDSVAHISDHVEAGEHVAGNAAHHLTGNLEHLGGPFSNPLPSVLMLTAIVVGIATTALALALIVRIREDYGTIEEDEILELDRRQEVGRKEKVRKS